MADLGKIFIFEKNPIHLQQYASSFEELGFFFFGTDNLYSLIQYAKEVKPDIVIIHVPKFHTLSEADISNIEAILCKSDCPSIYINQHISSNHSSHFNYWDFENESISYGQILDVIKQTAHKKTFH